jgi:hypothetical protein
LVLGPNGNLYFTSFVANPQTDTDSIRVYDRRGRFVDSIRLDEPGMPRAFAQAILFGPDGSLYVPISGSGPLTGEVRRYNVRTKDYDVFVDTGLLQSPQYLTFGRTGPATLAYGFETKK